MKAKIEKARKAYQDFTGRDPPHVKKARLPDKDVAGWKMGPVVGIAYEATRDGKRSKYFHEFKKSAQPDLVSADDGSQLYIAGGKYKVTDRGIEDMPRLFVVNPSPRRGRAKRKAAPMARRRRRHTVARRTRQVAVFHTNPRRRRRRHSVRRYARNPARRHYARNPIRHRRRRTSVRRYRRNPSIRRAAGGAANFTKMLLPAIGIGAGAIGSEIVMGYLPLPATWKTGVMRHVTKGVVGVSLGLVLGKVFRMRRLGNFFALGAVAIATHDAIKEYLSAHVPSIPGLSGMGMYSRALPSQFRGMGYVNSGSPIRLGEYRHALPSQFHGATTVHGTGGEMNNFVA